jgi:hypothetical protein
MFVLYQSTTVSGITDVLNGLVWSCIELPLIVFSLVGAPVVKLRDDVCPGLLP